MATSDVIRWTTSNVLTGQWMYEKNSGTLGHLAGRSGALTPGGEAT